MSDPDPQDRFSEAKAAFLLSAIRHAKGEAATKVAIAMMTFASRSDFDATGALMAWPSMRTLADLTGIFRSRIDRGIKSLEASGLVTVERPDKRGATHHNRYILAARNGRTGADNAHGPNGRTSVANSKSENGRTGADNAHGPNGRTHADAKSAPVGPKYIIPTGADPAGGGAVTRDPASPDADQGIIDPSDEHSDASAGARERARSADAQGADHPASDPEVASFDLDLVPEHAPVDGTVPMPVLRRGQHISLAERDALSAGWLQAEGPMMDDEEDEGPCPITAAAAELAEIHGETLGDLEAFADQVLDGFGGGLPEPAERAAFRAAKVIRAATAAGDAGHLWLVHKAVIFRLLERSTGGRTAAMAALARYDAAVRAASVAIREKHRADIHDKEEVEC